MESDLGKLFIGGISWDTNEGRLREYFKNFGEVVEAVIMKDRTTGRARGFGFVVFADPAVAERVLMEKHLIDGRMVEAKKAVPRDDQHILARSNTSVQGSPGHGRTKKIFVGGLASTVTDADFKKYFEQFGTITDVIVMYDHNTQRPRGFGFITFSSEDAVDKVLHSTFHELNGKMVEVKRAVPKELSPAPTMRSPIVGHNFGLNRINSFINGHSQGYNTSPMGNYGMRMNGRFAPLVGGRNPSFNPGYGVGMNFEPGLSPSYVGSSNFTNNLGYAQPLSQYYNGSSSRFANQIGFGGGNGSPGSAFNPEARNLWGNGGLNYSTNPGSNSYMTSRSGSISALGNSGLNWGASSSPLVAHGVGNDSAFPSGNLNYGTRENNFGLIAGSFGRSNGTGPANASFDATSNSFEGNFADSYGDNSIYGNSTWQLASSEIEGYSPFGHGIGAAASDVTSKGGYNVSNRHMHREG